MHPPHLSKSSHELLQLQVNKTNQNYEQDDCQAPHHGLIALDASGHRRQEHLGRTKVIVDIMQMALRPLECIPLVGELGHHIHANALGLQSRPSGVLQAAGTGPQPLCRISLRLLIKVRRAAQQAFSVQPRLHVANQGPAGQQLLLVLLQFSREGRAKRAHGLHLELHLLKGLCCALLRLNHLLPRGAALLRRAGAFDHRGQGAQLLNQLLVVFLVGLEDFRDRDNRLRASHLYRQGRDRSSCHCAHRQGRS
mmetsp:Transcript_28164/g.66906  ORF Transcript_28164/g.66906 Transcript_28164/m.66906 type:complete len:252 (-) Transcript_28164:2-757(-)